MSLTSLFTAIADDFNSMRIRHVTSDKYRERLTYWFGIAAAQKLKRDQYAINAFITYHAQTFSLDLSLVYIFNGKYYSTSKYQIPGTSSTETLHSLPEHIPSKGWNWMGQATMYPSGDVFDVIKTENTKFTQEFWGLVE